MGNKIVRQQGPPIDCSDSDEDFETISNVELVPPQEEGFFSDSESDDTSDDNSEVVNEVISEVAHEVVNEIISNIVNNKIANDDDNEVAYEVANDNELLEFPLNGRDSHLNGVDSHLNDNYIADDGDSEPPGISVGLTRELLVEYNRRFVKNLTNYL